MNRVLTPNLSLPLSVAPSGRGQSAESLRAMREDLRLLVVDGTTLTADERVYLWPRDSEVRDWYIQAAEQGVSLVVVRTRDSIELYTTQHDRQLACAAPLMNLAQRCRAKPELSRVRVFPYRGMDAAKYLLTLTAGVGTTRGKAKVTLARIEAAAQLAKKAGALSATLDSLFRTAVRVGGRVDEEALVQGSRSNESLRELVDISAARIVEEELMNWRSEQSRLFRSMSLSEHLVQKTMAAPHDSSLSEFPDDEESPSGVRIRIAADLGHLPTLSLAHGTTGVRR